jgi:Family of unknown function (DUF6511)
LDVGRLNICAVCGREAGGFGYMHPEGEKLLFRFCSMRCQDAGWVHATRNNGMIDKTNMEITAIKEARRFFAESLTELGLMPVFKERSAAEIDQLIEACVDGFQASMQRQVQAKDHMNDAIPF